MSKDVLYPLRRIHGWICEPKYQMQGIALKREYLKRIRELEKRKQPFVFLVFTPEHGNLGDHAIALAETEMLRKIGISFIEITGHQLMILRSHNLLGIMNRYPILVQGGGFLGTIWYESELVLREIIERNPKSKLLLFPNTIYYESNAWGNEELKKSIKLYNKHKNLTIYARERISYDFMKKIYSNVRLVPDVVFSLYPKVSKQARSGCLLCLRDDCEKTRTESQEQILYQQMRDIFGDNICYTDMNTGPVTVEYRETAVQTKFEQFSSAELVITDRLHGMIFCAITETPCLVVDSKSPKVRGCYEWIKHLNYIRFVDDVANIAEEYRKLPKTEYRYDNSDLKHYYESLMRHIQTIL